MIERKRKMAFGPRLCLFLLLAFSVLASARHIVSFSGSEMVLAFKGRSLKLSINDYDEPTANRGHDPPENKIGGGSGGGGNRRHGRKG